MKRLIVPTGYMGSGSSAVTDLLSEFRDCANGFNSYEYVFLHCPNGLFDLEDHLLVGNNAIKSDASIRMFYEQMKKLYDKPFWWVGNYKKVIGTEFIDYTNEFVDEITQFKFDGYWYFHEEVNTKIFLKLLIRKPLKAITRNKMFNKKVLKYNDGMKLSYIKADDFYKYAKKYVKKVLDVASRGKENVIMDQLLLPFNLFRVDNYFGNELKTIVVDRDPRDVFILNKYIWDSKKIGVPFPKDVKEYCKFYKLMRESEHKAESSKIYRVHFEDLIYNYKTTVADLMKFVGFSSKDHVKPKTKFIPELSIKNTQVFNGSEKYLKEVNYIEKELKEYLYEFPYRLENKVENTVEFDDWDVNNEKL